MSSSQITVNAFRAYLAQSLQSQGSETTIYLDRLTTLTGETIETADFSLLGRGTISIDPLSSSDIEFCSFTAVDSTNIALTGAIRGLSAKGNDSSTDRMPYHPVSTPVIIAFGVHNFNDFNTYALTAITNFETYVNNAVAGSVSTASDTNAGTVKVTVNPNSTLGTVTMTIAAPTVATLTSHGLILNDSIKFSTTGTLPTGVTAGVTYFILSSGLTANAFQFSATRGGTAITTTGSQTGTHTLVKTVATTLSSNDPKVNNTVSTTQISSTNPVVDALSMTGLITPYAGFSAPTGWLLCDGTAVSRTTYASLFGLVNPSLGIVTMTIAVPGVVSLTAHGLQTGDSIYLTTTGALPTGLSVNTRYWVVKNDANSFWLATSLANALVPTKITTSGSQSGTHTLNRCPYGVGDGSTTFNLPDLRGNVPVGLKTSDSGFAGVAQTGGEKTHQLTIAEMPAHTHAAANSLSGNAGSGASSVWQPGTSGSTGGDGAHNNLQPYISLNYLIKT